MNEHFEAQLVNLQYKMSESPEADKILKHLKQIYRDQKKNTEKEIYGSEKNHERYLALAKDYPEICEFRKFFILTAWNEFCFGELIGIYKKLRLSNKIK